MVVVAFVLVIEIFIRSRTCFVVVSVPASLAGVRFVMANSNLGAIR
jgi:hypothetical protein